MKTRHLNKRIKGINRVVLVFVLITVLTLHAKSQPINFGSLNEGKQHVLSAGVALEFTTNYSMQYAYRFKNAYVLSQLKLPFGSDVLDDWNWKTALQYQIWHKRIWSLKVEPVVQLNQFQSKMAKLSNISAGASSYFGIEQTKWGIGIMASYTQNFFSFIENGALNQFYSEIRDGWYGASGGYFKLGLTSNYNLPGWSLGCSIGEIFAKYFTDNPTVPYYLSLTISKTF